MNEKRRACAHINSSVRRAQQAVPAKMPRIAADPAFLRLRTPSPSATVLAYGKSVFLISWCSSPRRRTGLSSRMCRCGWVISDINRPAIAPSAQANHNAGSGRIHGAQHGPGSSCEDERLAGAGSRRVQGRWIGIALSLGALSAYAAAGIGDLIEDASSGGLLAVIAIDISIGLPDTGRRRLHGSHRRPRADCPVLGVIPLGMRAGSAGIRAV